MCISYLLKGFKAPEFVGFGSNLVGVFVALVLVLALVS